MDDITIDAPVINENVVVAYVDCLKVAYRETRELRTYSKEVYLHRKYDNMFRALALKLLAKGVGPFEYVNWCFDEILTRHDDVYPNMLGSSKLLIPFLESYDYHNEELELLVKAQAKIIKVREERGEGLDSILLDEDMPVGVVLRFAVAHSRGRPDLEAYFKEDTKKQLMLRPYYRKLLSNYLPPEMK